MDAVYIGLTLVVSVSVFYESGIEAVLSDGEQLCFHHVFLKDNSVYRISWEISG